MRYYSRVRGSAHCTGASRCVCSHSAPHYLPQAFSYIHGTRSQPAQRGSKPSGSRSSCCVPSALGARLQTLGALVDAQQGMAHARIGCIVHFEDEPPARHQWGAQRLGRKPHCAGDELATWVRRASLVASPIIEDRHSERAQIDQRLGFGRRRRITDRGRARGARQRC